MNQRIEDYVFGRMSEAEAREFEDYCVANPEFAKQVEFEQRLRAGFAHVARGSREEFVRSPSTWGWRFAAIAAGLLVCTLAVFYVWNRQAPSAPGPVLAAVSPGVAGKAQPVRLALVRGSARKPALQSGLARVEIAGLFDPDSHYTVALDRIGAPQDIETVATVHGVKPASPTALEVLVDSSQLPRGSYSLRVRKQTSVDEPLDFEFLRH